MNLFHLADAVSEHTAFKQKARRAEATTRVSPCAPHGSALTFKTTTILGGSL